MRCRTTFTKCDPRKDHRGVDLISDALPFGRLWYGEPNAMSNPIRFEKFSGACPEETMQQTARRQDYAGTNPGSVLHESARRPTSRLSAPVSAHSLLPKKVQPGILDFVTQKISSNA